jgi:hypothetical protein
MSRLPQDETARLFALDESLRSETDRMLAESGLGAIIEDAGYVAVGSYAMRTMTWRDLDFTRTAESPDWNEHLALSARLAGTGWVWRFTCLDAYHDPRVPGRVGLYCDLRVRSPRGGPTWKLDLWTARASEHLVRGRVAEERMKRMTEEARLDIIAIKDAFCRTFEYGDAVRSAHIYDAVLRHGVRSVEAFSEWWQARFGEQEGRRATAVRTLDPAEWRGTL